MKNHLSYTGKSQNKIGKSLHRDVFLSLTMEGLNNFKFLNRDYQTLTKKMPDFCQNLSCEVLDAIFHAATECFRKTFLLTSIEGTVY